MNPWWNSPLRDKTSEPTAGIRSTSPQTEVDDHPANLGMTSGQHVEFPAVVGFPNSYYSYKSLATQFLWVGTDPIR